MYTKYTLQSITLNIVIICYVIYKYVYIYIYIYIYIYFVIIYIFIYLVNSINFEKSIYGKESKAICTVTSIATSNISNALQYVPSVKKEIVYIK